VAGAILIELGVAAIAGGIVFTAIGSSKVKKYKSKMSGLSFGLAPKGNGLSLTYRF